MSRFHIVTRASDTAYLYDGTLEGFYCCVHASVYRREFPCAIFAPEETQESLFPPTEIVTDQGQAGKVRRAVAAHISPRALELTETVFCSCLPRREWRLLRILLRGWREGPSLLERLGDEELAPLLKAERHLGGEVQLLRGFVRFSDLGGMLAATITPKNFVLPFLAPHFAGRYPNENFLIFDKTHKAALLQEQGQLRLIRAERIEFPAVSELEAGYRALWRRFYDAVAIEARENPRCRMTHMPKRYWENMTEFGD
ncbi:MAG: TIGR03915 family putative DNA repair protein [Oscillospiraceae bacterium]|jgi:probable DNA metabolism protein|nr:TIGR03915 family putative DNA repair protein [Oscillospiraceae bacterium]